jgi:hypothetical protein
MNRMITELQFRVTLETTIAVVVLALPAAWLGGASAGIGVLAAGLLTLGNFWWLSRAASAAGASGAPRRELAGWIAAACSPRSPRCARAGTRTPSRWSSASPCCRAR